MAKLDGDELERAKCAEQARKETHRQRTDMNKRERDLFIGVITSNA